MLSKNKIKLINSLLHGKYRKEEGLYIAEGTKLIETLLDANKSMATIFATESWLASHALPSSTETVMIDEAEMKKISQLTTPTSVLGLIHLPKEIIPTST